MHIVSFDIEEWFLSYSASQIPVNKWESLPCRASQITLALLDFLDSHDQKATFFILGWLAEKDPDLIKEIAHRGHEIGYHSYVHILPENQTKKEFENELVNGLNQLTKIASKPICFYRAPQFSINEGSSWVYPVLAKNGITASSSVRSNIKISNITIPNSPFLVQTRNGDVWEFPLGRVSFLFRNWVYSGGGYIRFFPYNWIQKQFLRREYNIAYFHPRDFDHDIPSTPMLPVYRNWMNKYRNHTSYHKLVALLQEFRFVSLGMAIQQIEKQDSIMSIVVDNK